MSQPTAYILIGRSFAGKSTLRKELAKRFGFSVASVDWKIEEHGLKISEMTQDDWNKVYSDTYRRLEQLLKSGKTTILDLGNLKRSERITAKQIVQKLNIPHKFIYVNTSEDEVRKRWKEQQLLDGGRKMDEETFNKAQIKFEEPQSDENVILYNSEMNIDSWINKNILKIV